MSRFELNYYVNELKLSQPFTIARGTKKTVGNVFVELRADGITGYGEADPNNRYDEDAEKVCAFLEKLPPNFFDDIQSADQLAVELDNTSISSVQSAKSAIEMAWLDWQGKKESTSTEIDFWEKLVAREQHGNRRPRQA